MYVAALPLAFVVLITVVDLLLLRRGTKTSFVIRSLLLLALGYLFFCAFDQIEYVFNAAFLFFFVICLTLIVLIREFFLQRSRLLEQQSALIDLVRSIAFQNARPLSSGSRSNEE